MVGIAIRNHKGEFVAAAVASGETRAANWRLESAADAARNHGKEEQQDGDCLDHFWSLKIKNI